MKLVKYFLIICILFCSCHPNPTQNPIKAKQYSVSMQDRCEALALIIKIKANPNMTVQEIARQHEAELHYQKYLQEVENER